jgi:hypothetical protein
MRESIHALLEKCRQSSASTMAAQPTSTDTAPGPVDFSYYPMALRIDREWGFERILTGEGPLAIRLLSINRGHLAQFDNRGSVDSVLLVIVGRGHFLVPLDSSNDQALTEAPLRAEPLTAGTIAQLVARGEWALEATTDLALLQFSRKSRP